MKDREQIEQRMEELDAEMAPLLDRIAERNGGTQPGPSTPAIIDWAVIQWGLGDSDVMELSRLFFEYDELRDELIEVEDFEDG